MKNQKKKNNNNKKFSWEKKVDEINKIYFSGLKSLSKLWTSQNCV